MLLALAVLLVQPILVIGAGIVLGVMFDGGVRLLGRYLHIGPRLAAADRRARRASRSWSAPST